MRTLALRGILAIAACALITTAFTAPARAGTITLSYALGPGTSHEPATGFWTTVSGTLTVTVNAFRATPSASFGFISGGTVAFLSLTGGPTHSGGGPTNWTIGAAGGVYGAPGVAPVFLPSIMGSVNGITAFGSAFGSLGANVTGLPTVSNARVGQYNFAAGAFSPAGFLYWVATAKSLSGSGGAGACFDAAAGLGPCYTGFGATPSVLASGTVPGFLAFGAEVSRIVAIEPVPEPGTALLLGLGLTGLAVAGRRARRS